MHFAVRSIVSRVEIEKGDGYSGCQYNVYVYEGEQQIGLCRVYEISTLGYSHEVNCKEYTGNSVRLIMAKKKGCGDKSLVIYEIKVYGVKGRFRLS